MQSFKGKVAVITGASNGIGFGIAERCAQEGMKVVLAGINEENLIRAEAKLKPIGSPTMCVQTDVSRLDDIERLAQKTIEAFGGVHLLVNNAGVYVYGSVWESKLEDWQWVMGVNLWGVVYGVRVFIPIMLEQDTPCHIVNVSSLAGLVSTHSSAVYQVTKHGVVALTENLYHTLVQRGTKIRASVLCPGFVQSRIADAERNRPDALTNQDRDKPVDPVKEEILERIRQEVTSGLTPQEVAGIVFQAIENEQLYILTTPDWNDQIHQRVKNIINQRNPVV